MLTDSHIKQLWERMAMLYGHRWTSAYGVKDDGTWLTVLGDLTPEQLGTGLRAAVAAGEEWPPSAPAFRNLCLGKTGANEFGLDYVPEYYRTQPKITDRSRILSSDAREKNRSTARSHIAGLRAALAARNLQPGEEALNNIRKERIREQAEKEGVA